MKIENVKLNSLKFQNHQFLFDRLVLILQMNHLIIGMSQLEQFLLVQLGHHQRRIPPQRLQFLLQCRPSHFFLQLRPMRQRDKFLTKFHRLSQALDSLVVVSFLMWLPKYPMTQSTHRQAYRPWFLLLNLPQTMPLSIRQLAPDHHN